MKFVGFGRYGSNRWRARAIAVLVQHWSSLASVCWASLNGLRQPRTQGLTLNQLSIRTGSTRCCFDPVAQLRISGLPISKPRRQITPRFAGVAAVVEPARLAQTVVVPSPRQVIQRVPQEVHIV